MMYRQWIKNQGLPDTDDSYRQYMKHKNDKRPGKRLRGKIGYLLKQTPFPLCPYCNSLISRTDMTIDHIVPKARGGSDEVDNLVLCCKACNTKKLDNSLLGYIVSTNVENATRQNVKY